MNSSIPAGTVCQFGTFRTGSAIGAIIAPADRPYSRGVRGTYFGSEIYGTGNLTEYDDGTTYVFGDSDATGSNNLKWIKLSNTLLVADRNLLCGISWDDIYKIDNSSNTNTEQSIIGAATGTTVTIDGNTYRVRLLTGGLGNVAPCEWNNLVALAPSNDVSHWMACFSWCSETRGPKSFDDRIIRGSTSAMTYYSLNEGTRSAGYGFRPALELIE